MGNSSSEENKDSDRSANTRISNNPTHFNPNDTTQAMLKSLRRCLGIVSELHESGITVMEASNKMMVAGKEVTIKVNGRDDPKLYRIFRALVYNRDALCGVVQSYTSFFEEIEASAAKVNPAAPSSGRKSTPSVLNMDIVFKQATGLVKENKMLRDKMTTDTRHLLMGQTMKAIKPDAEQKKRIKSLIERNAELTERLAAEMNAKMASNETSLENISIPNRPMTVAEEYSLLTANAWLSAKTALDERFPDETYEDNKMQALCGVLMEAEQMAKTLYGSVLDKLTAHLKEPMVPSVTEEPAAGKLQQRDSSTTHCPQISTPLVSYGDEKLPHQVLNAVGDYFRNTADYVNLDKLNRMIMENTMKRNQEWKDMLSNLSEEDPVYEYIKQCARLAWKMVIQRPPMRFDVTAIRQKWHQNLDLEVAWNSDPHKDGAEIKYYKYPTLLHGDRQMVKGSVFVN